MPQVAIGTGSATQVINGALNSGANFPNSGIVKNVTGSAGTIYLGITTAVTTANGFPLAAGESASFDMLQTSIYAIADIACTAYVITRF